MILIWTVKYDSKAKWEAHSFLTGHRVCVEDDAYLTLAGVQGDNDKDDMRGEDGA